MATIITKDKLGDVVSAATETALAAVLRTGEIPSATDVATKARQVAQEVTTDPKIAPALVPVSRFDSQTIRGIVIAAGVPLVVALMRVAGVEIAEGDAATIVSTVVSLAGAAYAWYGRETTTRPLA